LSYIQVGAEGSDDRRHAVLQGSRASEAVLNLDYRRALVISSSLIRIEPRQRAGEELFD